VAAFSTGRLHFCACWELSVARAGDAAGWAERARLDHGSGAAALAAALIFCGLLSCRRAAASAELSSSCGVAEDKDATAAEPSLAARAAASKLEGSGEEEARWSSGSRLCATDWAASVGHEGHELVAVA